MILREFQTIRHPLKNGKSQNQQCVSVELSFMPYKMVIKSKAETEQCSIDCRKTKVITLHGQSQQT